MWQHTCLNQSKESCTINSMSNSDDEAAKDVIGIARERFMEPSGLEDKHLDATLGRLLTGGVDTADIGASLMRRGIWLSASTIIHLTGMDFSPGIKTRPFISTFLK
jgi:hypothetical protein